MATASAAPSANTGNDSNKPIIAAILSFFIPGLGMWYIKSSHALMYFVVWIVLWVVVGVLSMFLCGIPSVIGLAYSIVSAFDTYKEAMGMPNDRILKDIIK